MRNILNDTFCIYCQEEFKTPAKLQKHVLKEHEGTYAANSILKQRKENAKANTGN